MKEFILEHTMETTIIVLIIIFMCFIATIAYFDFTTRIEVAQIKYQCTQEQKK